MERPDFLNFSEITEPSSQSSTNKLAEEERQYIQLKPLRNQKSFSEPVLSPNPDKDGNVITSGLSNNKRSNSSPFVLGGYISSRRSVATEMPITKEYYSLFCLGPTNPIRRLAINITESKYPFLQSKV